MYHPRESNLIVSGGTQALLVFISHQMLLMCRVKNYYFHSSVNSKTKQNKNNKLLF